MLLGDLSLECCGQKSAIVLPPSGEMSNTVVPGWPLWRYSNTARIAVYRRTGKETTANVPFHRQPGTYPGFRPGGGHLLSKGPPRSPGGHQAIRDSRLLGSPRRPGAQKTGCPRMTAGAHWVSRGPLG